MKVRSPILGNKQPGVYNLLLRSCLISLLLILSVEPLSKGVEEKNTNFASGILNLDNFPKNE